MTDLPLLMIVVGVFRGIECRNFFSTRSCRWTKFAVGNEQ
jgi:hypothetical protein